SNKIFLLVSAASSNHFSSLKYLIESVTNNLLMNNNSLDQEGILFRFILYDIGLDLNNLKELSNILDYNYFSFGLEIRKFDFDFYSINLESYAWKPIIIYNIYQEY